MLQPYVRYFWAMDGYGDVQEEVTFATVADGLPGLIFQQLDEWQSLQGGDSLPIAYVYGQSVRSTRITMPARFRSIGVYFYPNALQSVFGLPAHQLTNSCVSLDSLDGLEGTALIEHLLNTGGANDRVAILADYLYKRVRHNQVKQDAEAIYAISRIQQANGRLGLRALRDDLRISERGFERKFHQAVGVAPKLFSRICQFQSALEHIRTGRFSSLTEVAFAHGYADQSHFIRTFRAFTDLSPKQYRQTLIETLPNFPQQIRIQGDDI
jgi:AraC-like DNA-binding protein